MRLPGMRTVLVWSPPEQTTVTNRARTRSRPGWRSRLYALLPGLAVVEVVGEALAPDRVGLRFVQAWGVTRVAAELYWWRLVGASRVDR